VSEIARFNCTSLIRKCMENVILSFSNYYPTYFVMTCKNIALLEKAEKKTHPVDTSHILMDLSRDDDKMKSPFGTKVTLDTL